MFLFQNQVVVLSKVPQVTLAFWVVKILATTVGETGGDAVSMTLKLGYADATLIFLAFFCATLAAQVLSGRYHPVFYWAVVVATTTVGTTTSDYLDRTVGLGYVKSSITLLCAVIAVLVIWRYTTGRIEFEHIASRNNEIFYWVTILVSNTLGTGAGRFCGQHHGPWLRARSAFNLPYAPTLNWSTYAALLRMAEIYLDKLRPYGARDFIDVQSFLWETCHNETTN